jgi:hypothetical protein
MLYDVQSRHRATISYVHAKAETGNKGSVLLTAAIFREALVMWSLPWKQTVH